MRWQIFFSTRSLKFIEKEEISNERIINIIRKAINKFDGKDVNVDIKKLKGKWKNFYRIRMGKIRIIAKFDFEKGVILIDVIDKRDRIY